MSTMTFPVESLDACAAEDVAVSASAAEVDPRARTVVSAEEKVLLLLLLWATRHCWSAATMASPLELLSSAAASHAEPANIGSSSMPQGADSSSSTAAAVEAAPQPEQQPLQERVMHEPQLAVSSLPPLPTLPQPQTELSAPAVASSSVAPAPEASAPPAASRPAKASSSSRRRKRPREVPHIVPEDAGIIRCM